MQRVTPSSQRPNVGDEGQAGLVAVKTSPTIRTGIRRPPNVIVGLGDMAQRSGPGS
jgi:hypothetical protein